jgi:DNA modification methylase
MKPYYEHGGITIYHGDCREILPSLGRFGLLLTDPPYVIGASAGTGKYGREKWTATDSGWDFAVPTAAELTALCEATDRQIIWGGNYFALPPTRNYFIWDKGAGFKGRDFAECELAWCSWDANARIFARDPLASGDYRGKTHPTEKPVALMKWCIARSITAGPILDPYAGSGTTGVAAKDCGMEAVLVEREERYCEIAAKRLSQEVLAL